MTKQSTDNILLIRPANFGFNPETADSNTFQKQQPFDQKTILAEFDNFAAKLKKKGVNVFVFDDTPKPAKPDAVFPNNWITFHPDGTVALYPMFAESRRRERRTDIIEKLKENFRIKKIEDFSHHETKEKFLEGTGSIVADHENKINYACLSPRTDKKLFEKISNHFGYQPLSFHAADEQGNEIYHTNVMMCVGSKFSVICLESVKEKDIVIESLQDTGKEIVDISFAQMNNFAGNMLSVATNKNTELLVLSQNAFDSLSNKQKNTLEKYCELFPVPIPTIETIGGGSIRCMMAEIFLPEV